MRLVRAGAGHRRSTITFVLILGLTAGVSAASLSVVAGYWWRPLPYPESARLAIVELPRENGPGVTRLRRVDWSGAREIADLIVASDPDGFAVMPAGDPPFAVDGRWINGEAFAMFGAVPAAGRFFTPDESRRNEPLAVIGYDLWQEHFGGALSVIGQTITVRPTLRDAAPSTFTIVGVVPRRFWHLEERVDLLLAFDATASPSLLRLRPAVSIDQAAERLTAIVRAQIPGIDSAWRVRVRSAQEAHVDRLRPMLAATIWGIALLAVVALANLTFLQMARGLGRQREAAVRTALGASRRDLIRESLFEGARVSMAALLIGGGLAWTFTSLGHTAIEQYLGRMMPGGLRLDPIVAAATLAATFGVGLLLHLAMFAASRSTTLAAALSGAASSTDSPARARVRQAIVASQVAVAFALLVASSLMIRSAWHLGHLDLGFDPSNVLSATVTLSDSSYRGTGAKVRFYNSLVERLEHIPGIGPTGLTTWLPFRVGPAYFVEPDEGPPSNTIEAGMQGVNRTYFSALGMRLIDGRAFNEGDQPGRERVAVISEALSKQLWSGGGAVGRAFRIRFSREPGRGFGPFRVVGVAPDSLRSLVDRTPPQVYVLIDQEPVILSAHLQVKTAGDPLEAAPIVAKALRDLDATVPLARVDTLANIVEREGVRPRFLAQVLAAFAALAFAAALVGLYAVSAWIAHQRRREAALRVALGADRGSVALLLVRGGFIAVGIGLAIGWTASLAIANAMSAEIHGVSPDSISLRLIIALVLSLTAAMALLRPAWQAAAFNLAKLLQTE